MIALADRLEWAKTFRNALSSRLGIRLKSEVKNVEYESGQEILSEECLTPSITSEEDGFHFEVDVMAEQILVRHPIARGKRCFIVIEITEGIGNRMATDMPDEQIIDLLEEARNDSLRRYAQRRLRDLREEVRKSQRKIDRLKGLARP